MTFRCLKIAKFMSKRKPLTSHNPITLIYVGGTFGSHGKPLTPLPADTFSELMTTHLSKLPVTIDWKNGVWVKDSSQLTPQDFMALYTQILNLYADGNRQFVVITGTDTLSYLGAFLSEAFAGSDICLILTASMKPLFDANVVADTVDDYVIDGTSDAWQNLNDAAGLAMHGETGVKIAMAGEAWHAQTVQKIHSHDLMAFSGHFRAGYPATSYGKVLPPQRRGHWVDDSMAKLEAIQSRADTARIHTVYCVPNDANLLAEQLQTIANQPASGVILLGFGAGNIPQSEAVATALDALYEAGHLVVCTTQCPYGGVSDAYASGNWQYEHHVLSGGRLTIPAIYARLLWLTLAFEPPARRRQRWTYTVNHKPTR